MGIKFGDEHRSKPAVDKIPGLVLSSGSFDVTWIGKLEGAGPEKGDTMGNSEGTRVENKRGISDGEVMSITLRVVDRRKLGGDKELGPLLSDSTVEGAGIGYIEDGIVDIEDLELVVTLGLEGVYDGELSGGILDANEYIAVLSLGVSLETVVLSGIGVSNDLLDIIEDENIEVSEMGGYLG